MWYEIENLTLCPSMNAFNFNFLDKEIYKKLYELNIYANSLLFYI